MTKFAKMSMVAAVAVAGFASTASAGNLEDAIKGVQVSGYVDYRLENKSVENNSAKSFNVNEYAVNVTANSKVNDVVSATVSVGFDEVTTDNTNSNESSAANQDANPSLNVDKAYFTANIGGVALMAGKQAIPSVFVDKVDTVKTGAGVVALSKINDSLTVAAAHFMNNNIKTVFGTTTMTGHTAEVLATDTKTTELVAVINAGIANVEARYNMTDVAHLGGGTEADGYYVKATANVAGIALDARYAAMSADSADGLKWADSSVAQLRASTNVGPVTLNAAVAKADKSLGSNAVKTDVALDGDNDADTHLKVWQLSTAAITNKGNAYSVGASMPVAQNVTASLTYAQATDDGVGAAHDTDYTETLAQLTYKMSNNFTVHGRYSVLNTDTGTTDTDTKYSRIQVRYTF